MLNLNVCITDLLPGLLNQTIVPQPAMRPSATQLLQHERLALISKVVEAEKMWVVFFFHS